MPVSVGVANALVATPAVTAVLALDATGWAAKYALYFTRAQKQAPRPYLVMHEVDTPPLVHSMDGPSSQSDGEFQFDSYADDQATARKLSKAVRDALKNFSSGLSDGTTIQFYEVAFDSDDGYELGGKDYVYRRVLRLRAFYTEPGE